LVKRKVCCFATEHTGKAPRLNFDVHVIEVDIFPALACVLIDDGLQLLANISGILNVKSPLFNFPINGTTLYSYFMMFLPMRCCVFQPKDNHSRRSADDSGKAGIRPCPDRATRHIFQPPKSDNRNTSVQTGTPPAPAAAPAFDIASPI